MKYLVTAITFKGETQKEIQLVFNTPEEIEKHFQNRMFVKDFDGYSYRITLKENFDLIKFAFRHIDHFGRANTEVDSFYTELTETNRILSEVYGKLNANDTLLKVWSDGSVLYDLDTI